MSQTTERARPAADGRVAIVTGAGRGIGRAVASTLAACGYRVMAVSRTLAELRTLAEETGVDYLAESVATSEGCERIIEQTRSRLGPIDVLVNNAGVLSSAERSVWEEDLFVWHRSSRRTYTGPSNSSLGSSDGGSQGSSFEETWAEAVAAYPAQRPVDPQEIADTIAFLASDAASGINGETVKIARGGIW